RATSNRPVIASDLYPIYFTLRKTDEIRSRIFSMRGFYEMNRSRFTDSQIMGAPKRVESGLALPDLRWGLGIRSIQND
ncbi:hypothetical protein, partial [Burkholderia humptydooensis]|uniref:hypothetical protein n=1 Tax=Burkholderia humptydooensis TaxID=430531 RepID=UPI001E5A449F